MILPTHFPSLLPLCSHPSHSIRNFLYNFHNDMPTDLTITSLTIHHRIQQVSVSSRFFFLKKGRSYPVLGAASLLILRYFLAEDWGRVLLEIKECEEPWKQGQKSRTTQRKLSLWGAVPSERGITNPRSIECFRKLVSCQNFRPSPLPCGPYFSWAVILTHSILWPHGYAKSVIL